MKIRITFDFDDNVRKAISFRVGDATPATHRRCKDWIDNVINATLEDVVQEYEINMGLAAAEYKGTK